MNITRKPPQPANHQQHARNSRRDEIGDIISPRGSPAKCAPALFFVADEAVGGVQHLVSEQPRQAPDSKPEGRRDDSVIEAFSETLQRRRGHA